MFISLTVYEVAELLRLNQQTVRNMIDRGELAAVAVGTRRVRIRQSDLDRFLEAGSKRSEGAEQFAVLVGPFDSRQAAEAWRDEQATEATDLQAEVMPMPGRSTSSSAS